MPSFVLPNPLNYLPFYNQKETSFTRRKLLNNFCTTLFCPFYLSKGWGGDVRGAWGLILPLPPVFIYLFILICPVGICLPFHIQIINLKNNFRSVIDCSFKKYIYIINKQLQCSTILSKKEETPIGNIPDRNLPCSLSTICPREDIGQPNMLEWKTFWTNLSHSEIFQTSSLELKTRLCNQNDEELHLSQRQTCTYIFF